MDIESVLILTGDAGAGHMSCSNALKKAFERKFPKVNVEIVDVFQFTPFSRKYDWILTIVTKSALAKFIFDFIYKLIDSSKFFSNIGYFFILKRIYKPTLDTIQHTKADLVIANNPLVSEVVTKCRREIDFKYIVTVTDIGSVSRWWASDNADMIFSPTTQTTERLLRFCPSCKIVTGYYSLRNVEKFSEEEIYKERVSFCKKASFNFSEPIILITGSGISTVKIFKKIQHFIKRSRYQFVILTGRDIKLEKSLREQFSENKRIFVQGFTDEILTFFSIADVIIAKPGANTVLEIEKLGKRAIFTDTVGYQESGNVDYLKENPNFVYVGEEYSRVPDEIEKMLKKEVEIAEERIKDANGIVEEISLADL